MICVCAGYDFNPPVIALKVMDILQRNPEHALLARQVEQMFDKAGTMN